MTSDDVQRLVEGEIGGRWQTSNAHGVDLRRCLIVPPQLVQMTYARPLGPGIPAEDVSINVWLVLEEVPDTKDGYKIVYFEDEEMFGLAIAGLKGRNDIYLGPYGDFMTTLEAM